MAVALSSNPPPQTSTGKGLLSSGRRSRSGRARLMKLTPVERSFEESRHVLYPAQKKLTTVESQRIMTVAKETKKRLEGVMIIPQLPEHIERFGVAMGTELVTMLREFESLSCEYMKCYDMLLQLQIEPEQLLHTQPSQDSLGSHTPRLPPIQDTPHSAVNEFKTVRSKLHHLTKCILRELSQCPSIDNISKEMLATSPPNHGHILSLFSEIVQLMEETLLTTHEEEVKREEYLTLINERYLDSQSEISTLESELKYAKEERDREVYKCI